MSQKQSAFQYAAQGGKGARQADDREPLGLPVPTLEQRAHLLLRAVHGDREFSRSEHSKAQSAILDAMAADIAAKSNGEMSAGQREKLPGPTIGRDDRPGPTVVMSARPPMARRACLSVEDRFIFNDI
jgi:hypothetical protein